MGEVKELTFDIVSEQNLFLRIVRHDLKMKRPSFILWKTALETNMLKFLLPVQHFQHYRQKWC
jgi:hypothetical protein